MSESINKEKAGIELRSYIPELLAQKGWSNPEFVRRCLNAGISQYTAYRLINRETVFQTDTLSKLAQVFEVGSISALVDIAGQLPELQAVLDG